MSGRFTTMDMRGFMRTGGFNSLERLEHDRLAVEGMMFPARCCHCERIYDLSKVTVVQRYTDCSVWLCPGCKLQVDDRGANGWGGRRDYVELDSGGREKRR